MIRTDVLLAPFDLLLILVNFEPIGGRAVELVVGVSCTDLSHKQTCVCNHYRKRKKKHVGQKE
jgi:hypothetical protein